jgi:S-formylglutathione hydrolase FrmB
MVFKFAVPLSSVGGRSMSGTGTILNGTISAGDPREYVVSLSGVTNAQYVTVTLTNVVDVAGNTSASVAATMGVLLGDTTGNGAVNSSDIAQTQSRSGETVTPANCRDDVNLTDTINSSDIANIQVQSGTALPSPPSASSAPSREQNRLRQKRR